MDLIDSLVLYSGLPEEYARRRLMFLIREHGLSPEHISVNEIREVAASFLQEIILNEANEDF